MAHRHFFPHSQLSRFLGWRKEIKEMLMGADFTEIADFEKQVGFWYLTPQRPKDQVITGLFPTKFSLFTHASWIFSVSRSIKQDT